MRNSFWVLPFLPFLLGAHEVESEIVVTLPKQKETTPLIYISCNYPKLRDLLLFDLSHNGVTKGVSQKAEEEAQIASTDPFLLTFWESRGYDYVLKISALDRSIFGTLFSCHTGESRDISSRSLEKVHLLDRRMMHQMSEEIETLITQKKGIAASQIYYAVQFLENGRWNSEIWTADYDGKNARQLTREKSYCIHPTLFPAQGRFTQNKYLYVNYKLGQPKVYINSFDTFQGKMLMTIRGSQLLPALSKKGDMIAFICDASGRADLFIQPFDPDRGPIGKPVQLYSSPHSVQASPSFRPDGKKIAFVSDLDKTPRVYLIDLPTHGGGKRPHPICLTRKYPENTCPAWSPDGKKLAYSAKIGGFRQIVVYDFVKQEEIQLTSGAIHKENPCWGPNSTHIIFNTVAPSSSELFLIDLKQREMVQITEGPGRKHYPTWGQ